MSTSCPSQRPWRPLREKSQGNDWQGNLGQGNILEMPSFIPLPTIPLSMPWNLRKPLISMIILAGSAQFFSGRRAQAGCTLNFNRRSQPAMLSF